MMTLPDTRYSLLARLAQPDDAAAWDEFVATYQSAIYRYARGRSLGDSDANDLVQRVLMAVHQAVGSWQPSGRSGSFRAWLFRTAHLLCLKSIRERQRHAFSTGGSSAVKQLHAIADSQSIQTGSDGQQSAEDWERWAFCWAASQIEQEVEPHSWQAFWLTAIENHPAAKVAEQLGMRVGAVYAAKCRILAKLRTVVGQLSRGDL
jgi:RNA polymerase sigma factor (sigma-70 family)